MKWVLKKKANEKQVDKLSKEINVSKPIANLLVNRGVNNYKEAESFFRPNINELHNPFLMKDMDKAVSRIENAIKNNENVMIYGDYDVDGTTSVSMLYSFLKNKIKNITYYIPDRYTEGYGISIKGIDFAKKEGYSLIIALDCGIKANKQVDYALKNGIEFIICDHHEQGDVVPNAIAVLDPKQKECNYPFKELSACGVGFKLLQAFSEKNNIPPSEIMQYIDLVAVSIASDIVPIINENRILAYYGLKKINSTPILGLKSIINIAKLTPNNIKISDIVFKIGPRINAAGRIEQGISSVDLLVNINEDDAIHIAQKIDDYNKERRQLDASITQEAIDMIKQNSFMQNKKSTVLYNKNWHKGVLGIVASRVIEHFYKPTIIFTVSNGIATGSARSVRDFNLYNAIEKCSHLIENFGGHKYAAGLSVKEENIDKFAELFERVVCESISTQSEFDIIEIDDEISLKNINTNFYNILNQFEPFGPQNMSPIFISKNVADTGYCKCIGKDNKHLRMYVTDKQTTESFQAIAFNMGDKYNIVKNSEFNICYNIEENTFNGKTNLQLNIKDIKADSDN